MFCCSLYSMYNGEGGYKLITLNSFKFVDTYFHGYIDSLNSTVSTFVQLLISWYDTSTIFTKIGIP